MADSTFLLKPKRHSLMGQQFARHRIGDDIFVHLAPAAVVDALSTSDGALRNYLAGASATEQDFAIRAAIASQKIWEWFNELSDWHWPMPDEGSSAGFENPNNRSSHRLSFQVHPPKTDRAEHIGSLPAEEVALYEKRLGEICSALADLELEEIKAQVLANHVVPMSRPGTPCSISSKATSCASTYTKMEDLSVIVTTIVLQTLPTLAKLTRLLTIWNIRVGVLQRIPALLYAMDDAEVGLKAGWTAISKPLRRSVQVDANGAVVQKTTLTSSDFAVMKKVLVKKVAAPGRILDAMLDSLEGMEDTLPDCWLNRMEVVEHNYSDWVATCERKIRETNWSRSTRSRKLAESPMPRTLSDVEESAVSLTYSSTSNNSPSGDSGVAIPSPVSSKTSSGHPINVHSQDGDTVYECGSHSPQRISAYDDSPLHNAELLHPYDSRSPKMPYHQRSFDSGMTADSSAEADDSMLFWNDQNITLEQNVLSSFNHRTMSPVGEEEEEEEAELPSLRSSIRQGSHGSEEFPMLPEDTSRFDVSFSDGPEVSTSPVVSQGRIHEAKFAHSDSPPNSPSLSLDCERRITSVPEDTDSSDSVYEKTPLRASSFGEDFDDSMSVSELADVTPRRDSSVSDRHLRQQISNIINSIPAKIKLSTDPPTVNLNPPDLQLPRLRKKTSKEPFKRSTSNLSSRTTTPSFTLSPSRCRPRTTRGQPEVRIYHLSRSTGEPPIKLFVRCVGEHGERVMVRVGGGWADLSEYLKEYATHHGRRSVSAEKPTKVELQDMPGNNSKASSVASGSSPHRPPSSAATAATEKSPMTPLNIRKARRSVSSVNQDVPRVPIKIPALISHHHHHRSADGTSSEDSQHSRPESRLSWPEDDTSFLGLAGPTGKRVEMSDENKAWVESVTEKVRQVSIERMVSPPEERKRFGELGRVGGTKRLFRKTVTESGTQAK
ncbi:hypothetical protein E4U13_001042 [Claviceps humidiphila]|uniref:GAR domain-containing protein n=1 Tax=Claviceps humidiphila TaxID=1294629 RepID=A0A9P7Q2W0_9HYPO|nr:hypothetical protein E4U13_001042 [Claviceps humidiphila]